MTAKQRLAGIGLRHLTSPQALHDLIVDREPDRVVIEICSNRRLGDRVRLAIVRFLNSTQPIIPSDLLNKFTEVWFLT